MILGVKGGGHFNNKLRAAYVTIISLCCTYRMLDLLLSIDMAHFSGQGGGQHGGLDLRGSVCVKERYF